MHVTSSCGAILTPMSPDGFQVGAHSPRLTKFQTNSAFFYLGIGLYVASFFLPAVDPSNFVVLPGWACAWFSLFALEDGRTMSALFFFSGLINPIAIVYILLRILGRAPRVRSGLASAVLLFAALTWLSLVFMQYRIKIGHFAWISGLLLMISWMDIPRYHRSAKPMASPSRPEP